MDPVCFLLYNSSVAFNFVYKPPLTPLDCAIKYFVGQELHTAYILHRHFFWYVKPPPFFLLRLCT
eukprot:4334677-Pyramimonas_sp.AAC.1